jgi:hypothetical protein
MKVILWWTIFVSVPVFSTNAGSTLDSTFLVNGKIRIATAGFAPVPAFSFNDPIFVVFITIKNKRFSYEPDFALGLNGKPWMINNWLRIKIVDRKKITIKSGINPGLFFKSEEIISGEEVIHAQRNFSFDTGVEFKLSKKWTLNLSYMHNYGCDPGTLSGNFFDAAASLTSVSLSKSIFLDIKQELFYFDFDNLKGLFASSSMQVNNDHIPLSIFFQGVLPLWANFPGNHFKWNVGLAYSF